MRSTNIFQITENIRCPIILLRSVPERNRDVASTSTWNGMISFNTKNKTHYRMFRSPMTFVIHQVTFFQKKKFQPNLKHKVERK